MDTLTLLLAIAAVILLMLYVTERTHNTWLRTEVKRLGEERERTVRELDHLAGLTRATVKRLREHVPATKPPRPIDPTLRRIMEDSSCSDDFVNRAIYAAMPEAPKDILR